MFHLSDTPTILKTKRPSTIIIMIITDSRNFSSSIPDDGELEDAEEKTFHDGNRSEPITTTRTILATTAPSVKQSEREEKWSINLKPKVSVAPTVWVWGRTKDGRGADRRRPALQRERVPFEAAPVPPARQRCDRFGLRSLYVWESRETKLLQKDRRSKR